MRIDLTALLVCLPVIAQAGETDITAMSDAERQAFGAELRALFADEPELAQGAFGPSPQDMLDSYYASGIADDLSRLKAHAEQLFPEGEALAVFYDPAAMPDLPDQVSAATGVRIATFTKGDAGAEALARSIGLDMWPFYVTPTRMIRGDFPPDLLTRYLD